MSDLIRREDVIRLLHYNCDEHCSAVVSEFEELHAADAVEVVRCSRCKYWEPTNNSWMDRNRTDGVCRALMEFRIAERYMTEKDHFCGFGERREEDEVD